MCKYCVHSTPIHIIQGPNYLGHINPVSRHAKERIKRGIDNKDYVSDDSPKGIIEFRHEQMNEFIIEVDQLLNKWPTSFEQVIGMLDDLVHTE
jgi:hypothetical protein